MPRRYHAYPPEFQVLNVMSTAGASILGVGYLLPLVYLIWSLRYGGRRPPNPWSATGLEWQTPLAAADRELRQTPVVTEEAYAYAESTECCSHRRDGSGAPSRAPLRRPSSSTRRRRSACGSSSCTESCSSAAVRGYTVYRVGYPAAFSAGEPAPRRRRSACVNTAVLHRLEQLTDGAGGPRRAVGQAAPSARASSSRRWLAGRVVPRDQGDRVRRTSSTSTSSRARTSP